MFKVNYSDDDVQDVELFKGTKDECITFVSYKTSVDIERYEFSYFVDSFGQIKALYHITK